MPDAEPTVFIVDDDEAMRDALHTLMKSVGMKTSLHAGADEFLASHRPDQPGCLVLDVRMPGMSGLELQDKLAEKGIDLPVIIITGHGDVPMAVSAMRAGAVDFLEKPFREQDLIHRIHQAIELDAERRRKRAREADLAARLDSLTAREREVMDMVIAGKHNKAIAARLDISHKTVEFHRARIMKKMKAESVLQLVKMVIAART
jgi:RNA polymerase sigma factor (sigma-70 family)